MAYPTLEHKFLKSAGCEAFFFVFGLQRHTSTQAWKIANFLLSGTFGPLSADRPRKFFWWMRTHDYIKTIQRFDEVKSSWIIQDLMEGAKRPVLLKQSERALLAKWASDRRSEATVVTKVERVSGANERQEERSDGCSYSLLLYQRSTSAYGFAKWC